MRPMILACLLLSLAARFALAIKPASPDQVKEIYNQIVAANQMDAQIGAAETDLNKAIASKERADKRRAGKASDATPEAAMLTRSPSGVPGSPSDRDWVVQTAYAQFYQPQPPGRRNVDGPKASDIPPIEPRRSYKDLQGFPKRP